MDKSEVDSLDYVTSERSVNIDSDSDTSSSGSSLFKTQCAASPKQRQRNSAAKFVHSSASVQIDSSSDSSLEPRPLTLKAIFERFKKKKQRKRKRKYKPKLRARGRPKGSKNTRRLQIDKKQIKDKGTMFPVLELETGRKSLPWRKILSYEQAIARGFFNHIEKLKYEHHLKESLKQMDVGEDLEKDDLDSRRYKCLDDDGSISPIEEEEEDAASSECDITLVEDSCFIISSHFPKMNECIKQEKTRKEAPLSNESC